MKMCKNDLHDVEAEGGKLGNGHCRECARAANRTSKARTRAAVSGPPAPTRVMAVPVYSKDWREKRACDETTAELFFDTDNYWEAAELCYSCPVRALCLEENLYEKYGYVGGMTERQRQSLIMRRRNGGFEAAAEYVPTMPRRPARMAGKVVYALTDEEKADIEMLYDSGLGLRLIAQRTGLRRAAIHRHINSTGRTRTVEEQKRLSQANRTKAPDRQQTRTMAIKLFTEGYSVPETARMLDRSETTMYGIRRSLIREGHIPSD